jgi:hypothetical protein
MLREVKRIAESERGIAAFDDRSEIEQGELLHWNAILAPKQPPYSTATDPACD